MLIEGRTIREVFAISARAFGPPESTCRKFNDYIVTLAILKKIPGPWLVGPDADRVRAAAVEVVRGGAK